MAVIRLEGVSCEFRSEGGGSVRALEELSLEIERGETMALLGPSGCGKTTTLRLLNRLLAPTAGKILLNGEDTSAIDAVRLRRRMGYVVQRGGLLPHLTVRKNVGLLCKLEGWPSEKIAARVEELLELVNLPVKEYGHRYPRELSGGQRQRVGVARALALDPEILLMDEPFGALDPITRNKLQQEFSELEKLVEKTVVIVTHDLEEAFLLGDRVALLRGGRLVQLDTPARLRSHPADPWVQEFLSSGAGKAAPAAEVG
ncbi:MAG: ATP-binding cassette domain-containing protein [Kofleriaceae bacterium]